jgi:hypothetical protein
MIRMRGSEEYLTPDILRRRLLNYYGSLPAHVFRDSSKAEVLTHLTNMTPDTNMAWLLTEYQKLSALGVSLKNYD